MSVWDCYHLFKLRVISFFGVDSLCRTKTWKVFFFLSWILKPQVTRKHCLPVHGPPYGPLYGPVHRPPLRVPMKTMIKMTVRDLTYHLFCFVFCHCCLLYCDDERRSCVHLCRKRPITWLTCVYSLPASNCLCHFVRLNAPYVQSLVPDFKN